jgi:GYF domain 2
MCKKCQMSKKKYFIAEDDEQKGPFSFNELQEMGISKTTLIWKESFEDWTVAGKIEKLQSLLKITPPKLPKREVEKKNKDKTLNVNIGIGKPKTNIELKEKELAKEKLKTSVANTILYYLKYTFIAVIVFTLYTLLYFNYIQDYLRETRIDSYDNESVGGFLFLLIIIICFIIIFHRPMSITFNWFKKYSEKEI